MPVLLNVGLERHNIPVGFSAGLILHVRPDVIIEGFRLEGEGGHKSFDVALLEVAGGVDGPVASP